MSYATLAELKTWISSGGDIDTADDVALQRVLDASTRWIDRKCSRHFTLENDVTKLFYANDQGMVDVVDLVTINTIKSDTNGDRTYAATLTAGDYELLPYIDDGGLPATRFQQVRMWPTSSNTLTPGRLVQIVGDFGYLDAGAVPADIKQACLLMAAREWKRREMPTGALAVPDIGTVERIGRTDPDVEALLGPYIRANSWAIV